MAVRGADGAIKLSVIIACLDAAVTLPTQLEALASQPCPVPWELLICDNGSTDGTVEVAESYRPRVPNLRVLDASGTPGAGPARNVGAQHALGQWVAFCDADDEVAADWLTTMARALEENRFVAGRFGTERLNRPRVLRSRHLDQQDELQSTDLGARLPHAGAGNMGMHREDFLRIGGFDPRIRWLEDTDLSWRAQRAGVPLSFRPEIAVHVRLRSTYRAMYAQGRQYGVAHALLEARYGRPEPADAAPGPDAAPRHGSVGSAVSWVVDHLVGGRLFWRLGWVIGHRSGRGTQIGAPPGPLPTLVARGAGGEADIGPEPPARQENPGRQNPRPVNPPPPEQRRGSPSTASS